MNIQTRVRYVRGYLETNTITLVCNHPSCLSAPSNALLALYPPIFKIQQSWTLQPSLKEKTFCKKIDIFIMEMKRICSKQFRNYDETKDNVVHRHYQAMRKNQTLAYVKRMEEKWFSFDHDKLTIREAFEKLGTYVDSSDPDTSFPNIEHSFQTAEAIRRDGHPDWFQLVGLIHDLGKLMFLWGVPEDGQCGSVEGPQWGLSGDTWVVGCRLSESSVFPELNKTNADMKDPLLSSELGIYSENCGLEMLKFAFGHDEYLYRVLKNAGSTIPEEGLQMIRLHSCYPLHQHHAYKFLLTSDDHITLDWVKTFNKYDLYTKSDIRPNIKPLWIYYTSLIEKYCPGKMDW